MDDPTDTSEQRPDQGPLGPGWRWLLKLRPLPRLNLRTVDYLFVAVGFGPFALTVMVAAALVSLLAAFGVRDAYLAVLPLGVGVGAVLSMLAVRSLPRQVQEVLDEEDDGEDELAEDATPAIFGVSDPDAGSGDLAGADAGLAPPDESQLSGPR